MSATYCTGLWLIGGNEKRCPEHYFQLVPQTCRMIANSSLVLHCNDDVIEELFRNNAYAHSIDLEVIRIPIEELPFQDYAQGLVECCKRMNLVEPPKSFNREKGLRHYWRDYRGSGEAVYRQLLAIWLSKISLACRVAESENREFVAWIDASIARFDRRGNWDFTKIKPQDGQVQHYASSMRYHGNRLPISASFLQTNSQGWQRLSDRFEQALQDHLSDDYAHDEETILAACHAAEPTLFEFIGRRKNRLIKRIKRLLSSRR